MNDREADRTVPASGVNVSSGRFDFVALTSLPGRRFDWRLPAFETRVVVRVAYGIKDANSGFFSASSCAELSFK
jgi:hypothetical protein